MKKDKEWLKNEVEAQNIILDKGYIYTEDVLKLIDQLDEPSVSNETVSDILDSNRKLSKRIKELDAKLEEAEQEKVVVPQFVADFITEIKPNFNIRAVFTLQNNKHEQGQKWALDNPDVFARAWINGYSVEKEKLYRVKLLPIDRGYLAQWDGTSLQIEDADNGEHYENCKTIFTEQEIKTFDERFWTFAEEITK